MCDRLKRLHCWNVRYSRLNETTLCPQRAPYRSETC
jgi:hypothetical protein